MHEVLVNRLGGLSLPRKSVVRLTDHPDMTLDVYRGRKTTMQQQQSSHLREGTKLSYSQINTVLCHRDASQKVLLLTSAGEFAKKTFRPYWNGSSRCIMVWVLPRCKSTFVPIFWVKMSVGLHV